MSQTLFPKSKINQINDLVLSGKDPIEAARLVSPGAPRPDIDARRYRANAFITERNREKFHEVGVEDIEPYALLRDAMRDATVTTRRNQVDAQGNMYIEYYEKPDWPTRIQAAKTYMHLVGADPKAETRINIAAMMNANGQTAVTVSIQEMYTTVALLPDTEEAIRAYNDIQRGAKEGSYQVVIPGEFIVQGEEK